MKKLAAPDTLTVVPVNRTVKDEALSALVMLGFARNAAEKVLEQEINRNAGVLTVENNFTKIIFEDNGIRINLEKYGDDMFKFSKVFHSGSLRYHKCCFILKKAKLFV